MTYRQTDIVGKTEINTDRQTDSFAGPVFLLTFMQSLTPKYDLERTNKDAKTKQKEGNLIKTGIRLG